MTVYTVGSAIKELEKFPSDMPLYIGSIFKTKYDPIYSDVISILMCSEGYKAIMYTNLFLNDTETPYISVILPRTDGDK